jgi:predicted CXXCH cytochrome family protein
MHTHRRLTKPGFLITVVGLGLALLALLVLPAPAYAQDGGGEDWTTPDGCASCHADEYNVWHDSLHSGALVDPGFIEAWNRAGSPKYCYECHATGYDPVQGSVNYEGVGCLACHDFATDEDAPHMTTSTDAAVCGQCHTGNHAPDYDEWLTSDHATMNITCLDCHQSHDTGLVIADPTELCASCHEDQMDDSVHGQEGMACHDCHMAPGDEVTDPISGRTNGAGHTFEIPSSVCADCHGMTHALKKNAGEEDNVAAMEEALNEQMAELEDKANNNLNLGLAGGGIGGLLVGLVIPFVILRRRGDK